MYGCRIELQHDQAQAFFEEALYPDLEELQRRDAFLEQLEQEMNLQIHGSSIIMEIPDVNIDMLLNTEKTYISIEDLPCTLALGTTVNIEKRVSAYTIRPTIDIAA